MPTYPGGIYARPDPIPALRSTVPTLSTILGQYGDELEVIESTLGVNPQGASATVAARLDLHEAAWTSYSPTLANITLGTSSTVIARWKRIGRTIFYNGGIGLGTGGALTGAPTVSLPTAAASSGVTQIGVADYRDAGTTFATGNCRISTPTTEMGFTMSGIAGGVLSATAPWTWTVSDSIGWSIVYESAT